MFLVNIIVASVSVGGVLVVGVLVLVLSLVVAMGLIKQKKRNNKRNNKLFTAKGIILQQCYIHLVTLFIVPPL